MREDDMRPSENIEDRRGQDGGGGGGFGLGGGVGRGGLGIGAIVVIGLISWATGINPAILLQGAEMVSGNGQQQTYAPQQPSAPVRPGVPADQVGQFVARVLGETEDVWTQQLPAQTGRQYVKPTLVLYSGATRSGCGAAESAMGPFYCPDDQKLYLDTSFFQDMQQRFGGGGDFAYAYVIAHEVGHHIQNLMGILPKAQAAQARAGDRADSNAISVRIELMADCLAGVWANQMNLRHQNIDQNDVRQAVTAASAIGDDRLQRQARGTAVPDSFTHGTSEQRVRWLSAGLQSGRIDACDTFKAQQP